MKYALFDKCIITIDDNNIITNIFNDDINKSYERIGNNINKFICGKEFPKNYNYHFYESIEILKKANKMYNYKTETCGLHTEYYYNGNKKIEYFHNNNIKEGKYIEYTNTGKLSLECYYVNNKLHGLYRQYDSQNQINRFTYVNDIKHGEYFYDYHDHIVKGLYENGKIISRQSIEKRTNIITEKIYKDENYDSNNLLCNETYYKNGQLKEKYYVDSSNNKHGKYIMYFHDGQIQCISYYDNGCNVNETTIYYENGKIYKYIKYDNEVKYKKNLSLENYNNGALKIKITHNLDAKNIEVTENYDIYGNLLNYECKNTHGIIFTFTLNNKNYKSEYKNILELFAKKILP